MRDRLKEILWGYLGLPTLYNAPSAAFPFHFDCPFCGSKWSFHTQSQVDALQLHFKGHTAHEQQQPGW